jgi:hypothetical protein
MAVEIADLEKRAERLLIQRVTQEAKIELARKKAGLPAMEKKLEKIKAELVQVMDEGGIDQVEGSGFHATLIRANYGSMFIATDDDLRALDEIPEDRKLNCSRVHRKAEEALCAGFRGLSMRSVNHLKPPRFKNFFTLSELCDHLEDEGYAHDSKWIRRLEARGRIPKAMRVVRGKVSIRLWSPGQVEEIKEIIAQHRPGRPKSHA